MLSFAKSECGASLVEYAVALIIVTIVGGTGALAIGGDTGAMAEVASVTVDDARSDTEAALSN